MKKTKKSSKYRYIILLCMCIAGFLYTILHSEANTNIQQGIAKEIIRFHVVANSDTNVDQEVKLAVKDQVVHYMQGKLADAKTKKEAKCIMKTEIPQIKHIAQKTLKKEGYDYSCDVVYHQREFPIKVYGDLTFPAGKYEALDVVLGNAKGKNWWCVMFPSLCFVDGTYSIVPDNSKEKLQNVLTKEEYETISESETLKVQYAFKVKEWWNSAKEQILKIVE